MQRTRSLILKTAAEIFANEGFRGTTVRDIVDQAGVNLAAINYHFGSKEGLYREVMRNVLQDFHAEKIPVVDLSCAQAPDEAVRSVIRSLMAKADVQVPLAIGPPLPFDVPRLILQEFMSPSGVLDDLVDCEVKPHMARLGDMLVPLLGPKATVVDKIMVGFWLVSQCSAPPRAMGLLVSEPGGALIDLMAMTEELALAGVKRLAEMIAERNAVALA